MSTDAMTQPIGDGLDADATLAALTERFSVERDPQDKWGLSVIVQADQLRELVGFLRYDERLCYDMLVDVTAVDYLAYPAWRGARYAVVYLFKSLVLNHRIKLKVFVEEGEEAIPSIHDIYKIANWTEREVWDQYGIVFDGHPNLKRILNHHEFVGHPLRKDYPVQKRQHLSINDPMLDELTARLRQLGFSIIDHEATTPSGQDPEGAA
ncbi:MAG: NADH-quinone oxidoreductase subunit C [Planctomycetota bacterium]|jgi:NADH-quinone oxidoreductase subunit C|nr:NADH-quinone oxidoreductase subunit C [Planctomycetota bacterium]